MQNRSKDFYLLVNNEGHADNDRKWTESMDRKQQHKWATERSSKCITLNASIKISFCLSSAD